MYEFRDNWFSEINSLFKDIKIFALFYAFLSDWKKSSAQAVFGKRAGTVSSD